ncbi:MAG: dipeptide ABC transporter ATP-binding protein [Paracoccus sp. (in: a-proteobacteria)]|nr:dipeptide ABC transporter ATP-binding protein [Paracoccus sp. (in: a-proteobacteria)]
MSDPILSTNALEKRFTSGKSIIGKPTVIHAVNGVSLTIKRGETFAIVGESGCGKSTLARLLLRLLEPSAGTVSYEGQDLTSLSSARMRRLRAEMQFIFQDPFSSLNPRMTVETIVGEPLLVHSTLSRKERRARVADLLTKVGLRPDHAGRYPHEFSGGQRQRICVARALASGPKLLIGDEPVSALDVSVQAQIVNLLEDLKEDFGLTLIIIAHDLAVIRHMADRVAVMYLGEVIELAATEDLYSAPRHPYTRALLSAIPVPGPGRRDRAVPLGGDIPSPANPPSGCKFHTRCPHATEICHTTRPVLETGTAHQTACHHWRDLPELSEPVPAPAQSPATAARFALWREHST